MVRMVCCSPPISARPPGRSTWISASCCDATSRRTSGRTPTQRTETRAGSIEQQAVDAGVGQREPLTVSTRRGATYALPAATAFDAVTGLNYAYGTTLYGLNDAMWAKYRLGEFLKDYFAPNGRHYSRDNFLSVKPGTHRVERATARQDHRGHPDPGGGEHRRPVRRGAPCDGVYQITSGSGTPTPGTGLTSSGVAERRREKDMAPDGSATGLGSSQISEDGTATVTKTGVSLTAGRRLMRLVIDGEPLVTGLVAVGDAWAFVNPALGRGLSIGVVHFQRLLREAAFFTIQAQTPSLRRATLAQLERS